MKIKNPLKNKKSPYNTAKPRVRKSYYTFSKEYPAGNIPLERRIHLKFKTPSAKKRASALFTVILVCLSFFSVRLLLDISYKEPPLTTPGNIQTQQGEIAEESVLVSNGFRALYMPYEKLGDSAYIKSFIKKIRRNDCNSVIIDFKTENGKLCYSSLNSYAISGRCAIYDNNTVRQALAIFKEENITVAARIFCFLDNTIPESCPELAVKYMDTDVNWIDTANGADGKTWLNPCSKETLNYLLDIIKELSAFNIKGFILEKCHFPDSANTGGASFPGEESFKDKNAVLKLFISQVKKNISPDSFLVVTQSATDALNGNKKIYFGEIASASFDGLAAYTLDRPSDYVPDKKTDYTDMMTLFGAISKGYEEKAFIPVIDYSERTGKYMRTIQKNGYRNFIIFDEEGEY